MNKKCRKLFIEKKITYVTVMINSMSKCRSVYFSDHFNGNFHQELTNHQHESQKNKIKLSSR